MVGGCVHICWDNVFSDALGTTSQARPNVLSWKDEHSYQYALLGSAVAVMEKDFFQNIAFDMIRTCAALAM